MKSSIVPFFVFLLVLLIIRGHMGITLHLALSKKERKTYRFQLSLLDRWFFWSAPQIIKDKYSKRERKTIRYSAIFGTYRVILIVLNTELIAVIVLGFLSNASEYFKSIFSCCCGLFIISAMLSFVVMAAIEVSSNPRYHKKRYK